jgi:hypothetical protein
MRGAVAAADQRALFRALAALPAGSQVRFVDAQVGGGATGWRAAARAGEAAGWWAARRYAGGIDPAPALAAAWDEAAGRPNPAVVLWLHGAVPYDLADAAALGARYDRRPDGPGLVGLQLRPGPDALMDQLAGIRRVYALAARRDLDNLGDAVRLAAVAPRAERGEGLPLGGREPAINGLQIAAVSGGSHAGRLAAASNVLAPWYAGCRQGRVIEGARRQAIQARLVTPLSGAVVLETKAQYDRHNLDARVPSDGIPSVPEPGTLVLLATGGGIAALAAHRRRVQKERQS